MLPLKITILGSQWEIIDKASETDYPNLKDADGYCDFYAKQIVLGEFTTANGYEYADLESFRRKVLRHELVHAFLYESGMTQLARNEEVVDWFAIQAPKLLNMFQSLEVES